MRAFKHLIGQIITVGLSTQRLSTTISTETDKPQFVRQVTLEFDGSFRPPRDPGRPTLATKLAVCSTALSMQDIESGQGDTPIENHPLLIGSSQLEVPVDMTSAHAEYHGLLLGLEALVEKHELIETRSSSAHDNSGVAPPTLLRVQGDCKAVIDQLLGNSIPRKVQGLYDTAINRLESLSSHFDRIEYVHIPRDENQLCDNLCSNLISVRSFQDRLDCQQALDKQRNCPTEAADGLNLAQIFEKYLRSTGSTCIPYSDRPRLYKSMVIVARKSAAFDLLVQIGEQLCSESNRDQAQLLADGIRYQIEGWRGLENEKRAAQLQRKHRIILMRNPVSSPIVMMPEMTPQCTFLWDSSIVESHWKTFRDQWEDEAVLTDWKPPSKLWIF